MIYFTTFDLHLQFLPPIAAHFSSMDQHRTVIHRRRKRNENILKTYIYCIYAMHTVYRVPISENVDRPIFRDWWEKQGNNGGVTISRGFYECSFGNKMTASYLHLTFLSIQMNTQVYIMDENHTNHAQAHFVPNLKTETKPRFIG